MNRSHRAVARLTGIAVAICTVAFTTPAIARSEPPPTGNKIQPLLERRLDANGTASFWIRFDDRPDLSAASRAGGWAARGRAVVNALQRAATLSQAGVRARLDAAGVDYEPFWATNAIYVPSGSAELAAELAAKPGVTALYPSRVYEVPKLSGEQLRARTATTVEWGIANIKADQVWDQYGVRGQGIVVANIDTGVQYDHPALVNAYRGNNGDGTFSHDYNWFDASGSCPGAPCDVNGHGTHTMGTMVGDDGMGNQIGVAPGAKWIAANGCATCTDVDLIKSGQWMLAPTRLDGSDPDPAMRPNIINNSWGSEQPSNDPFMQDVTDAWAASGIFSVWSNGNIGPTCDTSSSPGSRISSYSVGAYDATDTIADFSSRGAGQDGETKPNISAPGVNVRSSVPGSGYAIADGTSMAAPHVAGAVALLWSAAPGLVGDIAATRNLLDGAAADTPDLACGGTADDNNVYGEGRLDALALVDSAPVQDTGTLTVHAVDAKTGAPVNGARITLTGPVSRERVTGADGTYSVALPAGDYQVSASAFGYADLSTHATVRSGQTTTTPLTMLATPRVQLSGTVTDGSGQGWPMYAKITLQGVPGGTTYTDPATGRYTISVPAKTTYSLAVTPQYAGYQPVTSDVTVGTTNTIRNLSVPAVLEPCRTAGYAYRYDGVGTEFTHGLPAGWTVSDNNASGTTWRFGDAFSNVLGERIGNQTGGVGGFAIGQSPGNGVAIDTTLTTPVFNLTNVDQPVIGFRQHFLTIIENADVELSLDGGSSWQTVLHQDRSVQGPQETVVPIPQAANQPQVQVRFHYYLARFTSGMWQLDDLYIGRRTCEPVSGGLLVGHVQDANTGQAVDGANVAVADNADETTVSSPTPLDDQLGDGFYALFVAGAGKHRVQVGAHEYLTQQRTVRTDRGAVTDATYSLTAGRLRIDTSALTDNVRIGHSDTAPVTLTNTGSAPVTVELSERSGLSPHADVDVTTTPGSTKLMRVPGHFSPLAFDNTTLGLDRQQPQAPGSPWLKLGNYPTRIMDNAVADYRDKVYSAGGVDGAQITDAAYVYDPVSAQWSPIAALPAARESAAGAFIGDKLYVATGWDGGTRATRTVFSYDPASDNWSTGADAPVAVAAAGRAVLDGKLYLVGGCTNACGENTVQRYDPQTNSWQVLAPYPDGRGHLACGALNSQLYCTGGIARTSTQVTNHTYAYDPTTNTWTQKADLPVPDLWGMAYTASYDRLMVSGGITSGAITNQGWIYDPDTNSWASLPPANQVLYRGGSACGLFRIGGSVGNFTPANSTAMLPTYGACTPQDVPWLSEQPHSQTILPGHKVRLSVRMDAQDVANGRYDASLWIKEDTPYLVAPIDVTMQVTNR